MWTVIGLLACGVVVGAAAVACLVAWAVARHAEDIEEGG